MMGFGIDKIQAEYVAEIKLRNINREYILKRTSEIEELEQAIAELEETLKSRRKIKNIIISELKAIIKNTPRRERPASYTLPRSRSMSRAKRLRITL